MSLLCLCNHGVLRHFDSDSCCWDRYRKYKDANIKLGLDEPSVHTEHEISLAGDIETGIESRETRYRKISQRVSQAGVVKDKFKRKLWNVLEDPNSGHLAQVRNTRPDLYHAR